MNQEIESDISFVRYVICKIAEYKIQKRAIIQKVSYDFFLRFS